jgi:hypothetical protein
LLRSWSRCSNDRLLKFLSIVEPLGAWRSSWDS